jgi:hypothetical protein
MILKTAPIYNILSLCIAKFNLMALLSHRKLCLLFLLIVLWPYHNNIIAQNWTPLGPAQKDEACPRTLLGSFSIDHYFYPSVAIDSSGFPYIAFRDVLYDHKISVRRFNGATWEYVGNPGFSAGNVFRTAIVMSHNSIPYVIFQDSLQGKKVTAMKFDGTTWVSVGTAGFTDTFARDFTAAIDDHDTLYVGYQAGYAGKGKVMKFDGAAWSYLGGSAGDTSAGLVMVLDTAGTPFIAFTDKAHFNKITVKKFDGSSWVIVDTAGFSANTGKLPSLTIGLDNNIYVAFIDGTFFDNKKSVMRFDGINWTYVGAPGCFTTTTSSAVLIDSAGAPYLFSKYYLGANYDSVYNKILKFNGTAWLASSPPSGIALKNNCFTSLYDQFHVIVGENGRPYLVFNEDFNSYASTFRVSKYDAGVWTRFGTEGIGNGDILATMKAAVDRSGTVYVAYRDNNYNHRLTVRKYDGANWVLVGNPGISGGLAQSFDIAIRDDGTPYVAYIEPIYQSALKYFDGANWVTLGGFYAYKSGGVHLVLDHSGNPIVSSNYTYMTAVDGYVSKYIGAVPTNLGGYDGIYQIGVNNTDSIFLLCNTNPVFPNSTSYKIEKVTGASSTTTLGTTGFNGFSGGARFCFSPAGELYVLNGNALKHYTGGEFYLEATLPSSFFPTSFTIGADSVFYFSGINTSGKMVVVKYDGTASSYIGDSTGIPETFADTYSLTLNVDTSSNLYVTYIGSNLVYTQMLNSSNGPLSLMKITIAAKEAGGDIEVSWNVMNNDEFSYYELERSADAISFEKLGQTTATGEINDRYSFWDTKPLRTDYYRIKGIAKNGKLIYSKTISLNMGAYNGRVSIFPNPVKDQQINLSFIDMDAGVYDISLTGVEGSVVYSTKIIHKGGSAVNRLDLNRSLNPGSYIMNVDGKAVHISQKLIVSGKL